MTPGAGIGGGPSMPPAPANKIETPTREIFNSSLTKLKEVISGLTPGSPEFKRAEHTLNSLTEAFNNCGKTGPTKGKHLVKVPSFSGSPVGSYTQNEGIPVDELIDIFNSSTDPEVQALKQKLIDNSKTYFESHYTKEHGENESAWTKEQKDTQDLRTRLEANFISKDYRATGNPEKDYEKAMEVLKNRRELKLVEEIPVAATAAPATPVTPPIVPPAPRATPQPAQNIETINPALEKLRDQYLHAKRLRGNVARGWMGKLFGRKLNFGGSGQPGAVLFAGKDMTFGGKEGAQDLEIVRKEYEDKLHEYRSTAITKINDDINARLMAGTITGAQATLEKQQKLIGLMEEEDKKIDDRAMTGIEKNFFEKTKTKWRQFTKTRLVTGMLLGGASALTAGTATGAALVGTRAVMGGMGTYIGVEAGLERYTKWLGHKGLTSEIGKAIKTSATSLTGHDLELNLASRIDSIPPAEIKKEAARLRMLQVEKGIALDKLSTLGDDGRIAALILKRNNELVAKEIIAAAGPMPLATSLAESLKLETDAFNAQAETEVDKERSKKWKRKLTAAVAGTTVGWIIGGKLIQKPDTIDLPKPLTPPGHLPINQIPLPHSIPEFHTVSEGDNLWKMIASTKSVANTMNGLSPEAQTHFIDALKDKFAAMTPDQLQSLGFDPKHALDSTSDIINNLKPGDVLDLHGVTDSTPLLAKTLVNAQNLSPEEISSIMHNNKEISTWLADPINRASLKGALNDSVIEKILKHTAESGGDNVDMINEPIVPPTTEINPEGHEGIYKNLNNGIDVPPESIAHPAAEVGLQGDVYQGYDGDDYRSYDVGTSSEAANPVALFEQALQRQAKLVAKAMGISIEDAKINIVEALDEKELKSFGFTGNKNSSVDITNFIRSLKK